jgi:Na+-transporting methylmalonyl-CoA/oxaloacetate decarboxylase gamma subunit
MIEDIILLVVVMGMGILVGRNWHSDNEREYKKRLLKEVDEELREELEVATNLNNSLKEDVVELKRKIRKLELERK